MTPISNNNLSVLPFYTNINEQNHRKSYAYGMIYPLYAPSAFLLPFQIMREHRNDAIASAEIYTKDGVFVADILTDLTNGGLQVVPYVSYNIDTIIFPANIANTLGLDDGQYYITISDGIEIWYSDIITIVDDVTPYLKIEWYDLEDFYCDAGIITYEQGQFKNVLYLACELGKPEYNFEEEGETRDGYFFAEKQLSEKVYKFFFTACEPLLDVMRLIRMADIITITDKYGREYNCDQFLITPQWQEQGDIASVTAEFQTASVAKKIGEGYIRAYLRDYNNDFNNDYNNEE